MILRPYQDEAVDSLFDFFVKHGGTNLDGTPARANPLIALPTGTGKSLVIAAAIKRAFKIYPSMRVIMATHVKELIKQNFGKMREAWPDAPIGIYSAGLKSKDVAQPIIFGGVQSMVGKVSLLGYRDWLIIDEAHLLADEGNYMRFIEELMMKNPYLKVVGLSATPYRMKLGSITNGKIFTHTCFDMTSIDGFARLLAEGYLCPLIPKRTNVQLDVSDVGMNSYGEYNQNELQASVDKTDINYAALSEFVQYGYDRRSWIVFASGIEHAEHLADMLNLHFGIPTVVIHSKKSEAENDKALEAWRSGEARCAVNMNALTTGVDHPGLDYIGMLRPTLSTGLWVQMLGRGTRPSPGKENCLVMDFAGNTKRLGPINDPVIPRPKSKGPPGDAPVKICPNCGTYNHASARQCVVCGLVFEAQVNINGQASTEELLRSDLPQVETFQVQAAYYSKHTSRSSGNSSIKVAYACGLRTFYEWVTVEGSGYASKKGRDWFRQRYPSEPPETNDEVLRYASFLRPPAQIRVWVNKKYPEVLAAEF